MLNVYATHLKRTESDETGEWTDKGLYDELCKELYKYCIKICDQTNDARTRLLAYLSEEEAEYLSEHNISYWNQGE